MSKISKQEPQSSQPTAPPPIQKVDLQSVKAQVQETSFKPEKSVSVPKYISLANERIKSE
jgi:hypothetical protein